ncbi:MAG: hypothetical protein ACREAU_08700 [Nitrosopumilaceae archaeon]
MTDLKVTGQYDTATEKVFQGSTVALPSYTIAGLTSIFLVAAKPGGLLAYVSDANGGEGAVVYSDEFPPGTFVWKDVATNAVVVA